MGSDVLVFIFLDYCCVYLFGLDVPIWVCDYIGLYYNCLSLFVSFWFIICVDIAFFISPLWFDDISLSINYSLILSGNLIISVITIDLASLEDNRIVGIFFIYFHIHLVCNHFTIRI